MSALLFTQEFLRWDEWWLQTNIAVTECSSYTKNYLIPSVTMWSQADGACMAEFGLHAKPDDNIHPDDFFIIRERAEKLALECANIRLRIIFCGKHGDIRLRFIPPKDGSLRDPFCDSALHLAKNLSEIFGIEKSWLKTFSYSVKKRVLKEGGEVVEYADWLKETHPSLN